MYNWTSWNVELKIWIQTRKQLVTWNCLQFTILNSYETLFRPRWTNAGLYFYMQMLGKLLLGINIYVSFRLIDFGSKYFCNTGWQNFVTENSGWCVNRATVFLTRPSFVCTFYGFDLLKNCRWLQFLIICMNRYNNLGFVRYILSSWTVIGDEMLLWSQYDYCSLYS